VTAGSSPEGGARIELELPGFTPAYKRATVLSARAQVAPSG